MNGDNVIYENMSFIGSIIIIMEREEIFVPV